jgi:ATP-dependent protease ClpP protease subunit
MAKEILLYSNINNWSAEYFISEMEAAKNEDVVVRMNTNGGSPEDMWGMLAKVSERTKATKIKVDGRAYSAGAFMLAYSNDVEALDVSQFLIHRAAYASFLESDANFMTEDRKKSLKVINDASRAALEAKIDVAKFAAITGKTLEDVFSIDSRIDVVLTAKEAKEIGLINKIVQLTPQISAEIESKFAIAASHDPNAQKPITTSIQKSNTNTMTIEKLKAEHPDVYAQITANAVAEERDRVGAFLAFAEVDTKAVVEGIKKGENLSQTAMAEFAMKAFSAKQIAAIEGENAPVVKTGAEATPKTEAEKNMAAFEDESNKILGINQTAK